MVNKQGSRSLTDFLGILDGRTNFCQYICWLCLDVAIAFSSSELLLKLVEQRATLLFIFLHISLCVSFVTEAANIMKECNFAEFHVLCVVGLHYALPVMVPLVSKRSEYYRVTLGWTCIGHIVTCLLCYYNTSFFFVQLPPPQFLSLIEPTVVLVVTLKQVSPAEEYVNVP